MNIEKKCYEFYITSLYNNYEERKKFANSNNILISNIIRFAQRYKKQLYCVFDIEKGKEINSFGISKDLIKKENINLLFKELFMIEKRDFISIDTVLRKYMINYSLDDMYIILENVSKYCFANLKGRTRVGIVSAYILEVLNYYIDILEKIYFNDDQDRYLLLYDSYNLCVLNEWQVNENLDYSKYKNGVVFACKYLKLKKENIEKSRQYDKEYNNIYDIFFLNDDIFLIYNILKNNNISIKNDINNIRKNLKYYILNKFQSYDKNYFSLFDEFDRKISDYLKYIENHKEYENSKDDNKSFTYGVNGYAINYIKKFIDSDICNLEEFCNSKKIGISGFIEMVEIVKECDYELYIKYIEKVKKINEIFDNETYKFYKSYIMDFINSDFYSIDYFNIFNDIDRIKWNRVIKIIEKIDLELYKLYIDKIKNAKNNVYSNCVNDIKLLASKLNSKEKVDIIDYYNMTKIDIYSLSILCSELFSSKKINYNEFLLIQSFAKRLVNSDYKMSKERLFEIDFTFIIDGIQKNITLEDKKKVIEYLYKNAIPLTAITFTIAVRRYAYDDLYTKKEEKVKKKNLVKED